MNPIISVLLDNLVEVVGALLMVAAVPLLHALYRKFEALTGLKVEAETQRRIESIVYDGINKAEQWARTRTKAGQSTAGSEKLSHALEFVQTSMKETGLAEMSKERLTALIEAKLGQW